MNEVWEPAAVPAAAVALEAAGLSPWKAACLARRGVESAEQAAAFLSPSAEQLSAPETLPGIDKTASLVVTESAKLCADRAG